MLARCMLVTLPKLAWHSMVQEWTHSGMFHEGGSLHGPHQKKGAGRLRSRTSLARRSALQLHHLPYQTPRWPGEKQHALHYFDRLVGSGAARRRCCKEKAVKEPHLQPLSKLWQLGRPHHLQQKQASTWGAGLTTDVHAERMGLALADGEPLASSDSSGRQCWAPASVAASAAACVAHLAWSPCVQVVSSVWRQDSRS